MCTVTTRHMITMLGFSQWTVGCEHRSLAVSGVDAEADDVHVSLLLEDKSVYWRYARGRVTCTETTEEG